MVRAHERADELDEEGPNKDGVGNDARRSRMEAKREHSDTEDEQRRRNQIQSSREQARKADPRMLARRAKPGEQAGDKPACDDDRHAHRQPVPKPAQARDRSDEELLKVSLRFFASYGDDLANWLMNELAQRDAAFDPTIGHEDFGWYVRFRFAGSIYQFAAAYRNPDWIGKLERRRTILEWIFRVPNKGVEDEALALIHHVLASSGLISDIWWHYPEDFDAPVM